MKFTNCINNGCKKLNHEYHMFKLFTDLKFPFIFILMLFSATEIMAQSEEELERAAVEIFVSTCAQPTCHIGPNAQMGMDLSLANFYASAVDEPSAENPSLKRVDPGKPELSYMMKKLKGDPDIVGLKMPFVGEISEEQIATIENWIRSIEEVDQSRKELVVDNIVRPFDGWQVINLPTTQTAPKGTGLFRISHRFNPALSDGFDALYGLDGSAIIFFGMGYAFTDNLHVSLGRTNASDNFELQGRYRLFDQTNDDKMPLSLSFQTNLNWISEKPLDENDRRFRGEAMKFSAQITASKLLFEKFGVAFVPGVIFNPDEDKDDEGPMMTLGLGARWNFSKRLSWSFEWAPIVAGYTLTDTFGNFNRFDSWGTGFEVATGGHSFQIVLTNSVGMATDQYFGGGDLDPSDIFDGDIRLGFNIYRVLNYGKKKNKIK